MVAGAIGVIGWFWIAALLDLQATAEKTTLDLTVRNMRTGLQLRMGELMLASRVREIPALAGQNPVQWLAQPPERYLGELDAPPQNPAPRSWYFDRRTRELVYYPGAALFGSLSGESGPMAWKVGPIGNVGKVREGDLSGVQLLQVPVG